jgi:hypothetical protein
MSKSNKLLCIYAFTKIFRHVTIYSVNFNVVCTYFSFPTFSYLHQGTLASYFQLIFNLSVSKTKECNCSLYPVTKSVISNLRQLLRVRSATLGGYAIAHITPSSTVRRGSIVVDIAHTSSSSKVAHLIQLLRVRSATLGGYAIVHIIPITRST